MKAARFWILVLAVALIAAACGGEDGSSEATPSNSDQSQEDDNGASGGAGDGSSTGGGGFTGDDARADAAGAGQDFPIPIPGGWEIDGQAVLEEQGVSATGVVQLYYATEDLDELVAFYDEWTQTQPDEYSRIESEGSVVLSKSSPLAQISILEDFEYQGELWTALQISAASE